jgi:hypothetical protein
VAASAIELAAFAATTAPGALNPRIDDCGVLRFSCWICTAHRVLLVRRLRAGPSLKQEQPDFAVQLEMVAAGEGSWSVGFQHHDADCVERWLLLGKKKVYWPFWASLDCQDPPARMAAPADRA